MRVRRGSLVCLLSSHGTDQGATRVRAFAAAMSSLGMVTRDILQSSPCQATCPSATPSAPLRRAAFLGLLALGDCVGTPQKDVSESTNSDKNPPKIRKISGLRTEIWYQNRRAKCSEGVVRCLCLNTTSTMENKDPGSARKATSNINLKRAGFGVSVLTAAFCCSKPLLSADSVLRPRGPDRAAGVAGGIYEHGAGVWSGHALEDQKGVHTARGVSVSACAFPRESRREGTATAHAGAPWCLGSRQLTNELGPLAGSRRWRQAARGCEQKGASVRAHEDSYHKLPEQFTQANKQEDVEEINNLNPET